MKKRLLLSLMAMCMAVAGFALEQGDFVYTPQGRFQITGANLNANCAFNDFTGWTVIGEGKTIADIFNVNGNGFAEGKNSIQCVDPTDSLGIYYKFEPASADGTYIVSFKMKGAVLDNVKVRIPGDGYKKHTNLVKVAGNDAQTYTYPATEGEVIVNTAEVLSEEWQEFCYAIQGDGTARTWFISFTSMATTIEIADLEIAPAMQFADLRQRDAMLEKMNAYKNCYDWPAAVLDDLGYNEIIAALEAIGDESGQAELDELIATAEEVVTEFVNANMDDFLSGGTKEYNYLGIAVDKFQKVSQIGIWNCLPAGRGHWTVGQYPDMAHYAGNTKWNYGNTEDPIGVYTQMTLDPGVYVFGIEAKAALREDNTSTSWTNNEGWDPAYGVAYVVKVVDGVATDTIVSVVKDLESLNFTKFLITAKIEEGTTYEIGMKAYCKDAYKEPANGSVVEVKDASLWAKTNNKYTKREYAYEADVLEQITTGRAQITTAVEYLDNASYVWGKADLKAVVDEVEPKIIAYEAMNQDEIIATFDKDLYVKTTADSTGILVYEVYQSAVKDIIAANKFFIAKNDTLASIQTAIDAAELTKSMRLYDASTGKEAFQAAIDAAKGVQTQMKASEYSEENAAAIVAAIATLEEAVEAYKDAVPASAKTTIVDIDFENDAVLNSENGLYSVAGAAGSMEFSSFSLDGTGNQPFEKGFWSNGEQLWKGYIRIGNGTGTVEFDPTENGSMGTNILQVSCDMYIQGLSGRSLGFFLKNVVEGENGLEDAEIFGLFRNYYNGTTDNNTCNVNVDKIWAKSGGSYNNASPSDAPEETLTANPLQKTHFEVIMDYGKKSMYCTVNSINGSDTSAEVDLEAIPTKFILQCNYNNNDRRAWFDNLKIQRIKAGDVTDGIQELKNADAKVVAPTKVIKNGRIVINGKYGVNGMIIK